MMTSIDSQRVAHDWVKYYYLSKEEKKNSAYFSAFEKLCDLVRDEPELAWTIIEDIRQLDSSDLILSNLAAGPLEDLLVHHGRQFIERFEILASQDPMFKKLLGAVWRNEISDDVWNRLKVVAGPSF